MTQLMACPDCWDGYKPNGDRCYTCGGYAVVYLFSVQNNAPDLPTEEAIRRMRLGNETKNSSVVDEHIKALEQLLETKT